MRRSPQLAAAAAALFWALAAGAAELDLRRLCDPYTPLTLIGLDTAGEVALFTMPSSQQEVPGWIVELRAAAPEARAYPDWRKRQRLGGSIAPGPVVAAGRCGGDCLQPLSWEDGGWRELGPPLEAPSTATVYTTRDGDGIPWLVLHQPTGEAGVVVAEALRLEGGAWRSHGRLPVAAVGSPAARPAQGGGILTGSGHFVAGRAPTPWVAGLPGLPGDQRGQLVPLGGSEVAYLARDGRFYLSRDGGAAWQANRWVPWDPRGGVAPAGPGWAADLPVAAHGVPLAVAWFDNRSAERTEIYLCEREPADGWRVVARLAGSEAVGEGEVGYSHLLRLANGRWLLLAGCEVRPRGAALRLRTVGPGGDSRVDSLRLLPAWLTAG